MAQKSVIDTYGPVEFFGELWAEFGSQRATEMVTWMMMFGATHGRSHSQMVDRLLTLGFSKSSVYRASADIKRYVKRLYAKRGAPLPEDFIDDVAELSEKIKSVEFMEKSSQAWEMAV